MMRCCSAHLALCLARHVRTNVRKLCIVQGLGFRWAGICIFTIAGVDDSGSGVYYPGVDDVIVDGSVGPAHSIVVCMRTCGSSAWYTSARIMVVASCRRATQHHDVVLILAQHDVVVRSEQYYRQRVGGVEVLHRIHPGV